MTVTKIIMIFMLIAFSITAAYMGGFKDGKNEFGWCTFEKPKALFTVMLKHTHLLVEETEEYYKFERVEIIR